MQARYESCWQRVRHKTDAWTANYGMGLHIQQVSDAGKEAITKYFWLTLWIYYAAMGFTKLSILVQYLRIFPQVTFRRSCYAMIVFVIVFNVWALFSGVFMCTPIPVFWHSLDLLDHRCLPRMATWFVSDNTPPLQAS